jgi:hypothetical protein
MFEELIKEVIKLIEATEKRASSRALGPQKNFEHAVKVILLDLWKSVKSIPEREVSINKRSGFYSEHPRYRDPRLQSCISSREPLQSVTSVSESAPRITR